MTKLECPHMQTDRQRPFLSFILAIVHWTKYILKEFDERNRCIKFGQNQAIHN